MAVGRACAKIILFGEHAVVYGRPGIAVPLRNLVAEAKIVEADRFSMSVNVALPRDDGLRKTIGMLIGKFHASDNQDIRISFSYPVGAGLGSSASVSVAIIKAMASLMKKELTDTQVNELAFECEKIFHGTPSGIDNSVVSFGRPVFYEAGSISFLKIAKPLQFLIVNSGSRQPTKEVVAEVRQRYEESKSHYESLFDKIGSISLSGRDALQKGDLQKIGDLMFENQAILKELGVSNASLESIVRISRENNAFGAKLAGAGSGGNAIILVDVSRKGKIIKALNHSGYNGIIEAEVA